MLKETLIFMLKQLFTTAYIVVKFVFNALLKWVKLLVTKNAHPSKHIVKAISFKTIEKPTYKKNTASNKQPKLWAANAPPFSLNKLNLTNKTQTLNFKTLTNVIHLKINTILIGKLIYYKASNITTRYKPKPKLMYY